MRIDSHQHFWKYDPKKHSWIDETMSRIRKQFMPEDLLPHLKKHGFSGCVAVQAEESEEETKFLLEQASKHDWIKKVVGWLDLCAADIEEKLEYYHAYPKLAGLRTVLQDKEPEALEDIRLLRGIGLLDQFGFSFDVLIYPRHMEKAYTLCEKFPEQRFVLDHLAKPDIKNGEFDHWSKWIKRMAGLPNLQCKISGMVTEADWYSWKGEQMTPYLEFVTEQFGTDRLMFGSDWPVCLLSGSYSQVFELVERYFSSFSETEKNGIFGKNALDFYRISP